MGSWKGVGDMSIEENREYEKSGKSSGLHARDERVETFYRSDVPGVEGGT